MLHYLRKALILSLILALMLLPVPLINAAEAPLPEPAPQHTEPLPTEDLGYGVGAVMASLFYSPAKITYAGLGLITSGLGFILSGGNTDVAANIMNPAIRGNYVVTPQHLKGEEALIFVGPPPAPDAQKAPQAPPPVSAQR